MFTPHLKLIGHVLKTQLRLDVLTPKHSGALVMEAQPQCKGRPAAIGRVLMRLVNF